MNHPGQQISLEALRRRPIIRLCLSAIRSMDLRVSNRFHRGYTCFTIIMIIMITYTQVLIVASLADLLHKRRFLNDGLNLISKQ